MKPIDHQPSPSGWGKGNGGNTGSGCVGMDEVAHPQIRNKSKNNQILLKLNAFPLFSLMIDARVADIVHDV
jgi:hypothetical protein